jgi:hypothetical protein
MDASSVFTTLAQHWLRAAGDAVHEELRACYATRAAKYLELAARERTQPSEPKDTGRLKA